MSEITIRKFKLVSETGNDFNFIKSVYHRFYWEVCRWWYKGSQSPYVSCSRVDFTGGYKIYINGTTPRMNLRMVWDGNGLTFHEPIDIRRILICKDLELVNSRQTTEYIDIRYDKKYPKFVLVYNGISDIPIDDAPVITTLPRWNDMNDYEPLQTVIAYTGDYTGGIPPITTRARFQYKVGASTDWTHGDWENDKPVDTPMSLELLPDYTVVRFQYQVRETDLGRSTSAFTTEQEVGGEALIETCTPLNQLPDLGSSETGQRVCYNGDVVKVEELPALPG